MSNSLTMSATVSPSNATDLRSPVPGGATRDRVKPTQSVKRAMASSGTALFRKSVTGPAIAPQTPTRHRPSGFVVCRVIPGWRCDWCGKVNDATAEFCRKCGRHV